MSETSASGESPAEPTSAMSGRRRWPAIVLVAAAGIAVGLGTGVAVADNDNDNGATATHRMADQMGAGHMMSPMVSLDAHGMRDACRQWMRATDTPADSGHRMGDR